MTYAIQGGASFPFVLHEQIGQGRWGRVHRATDLRTGHTVAVKEVDASGEPELTQGFRVLSRLSHPNVAPVLEYRELDEGAWVVMPLFGGADLVDVAAACAPAARARLVANVVRDIARALRYVHRAGWVHRDVKPANLLRDGRRFLLNDFGLAHPLASEAFTPPVGTPPYLAPESFLAWQTGPAVDWYALGVTAWELLTGELPFDGPSLQEEVVRKQRGVGPLPASVPPAWGPLLAGLLHPDPAARWNGEDVKRHLPALRTAADEFRGAPSDCRGATS